MSQDLMMYILYMMKEYGIDHCIISNADCATHDHSQNPIPKDYLTNQITANKTAIRFAKENKGKILAVLLPDTGERYLSTEMFN